MGFAIGLVFPALHAVVYQQILVCGVLVFVSVFASLRGSGANWRKACLVLALAPLPSYAFAILALPGWLITGHMALVCYWVVGAALRRPDVLGDDLEAEDLRSLRAGAASLFVGVGPVIGQYRGHEIPAYFVDARGTKHHFRSTCPDPMQLNMSAGQTLVRPGLIYEAEPGQETAAQ